MAEIKLVSVWFSNMSAENFAKNKFIVDCRDLDSAANFNAIYSEDDPAV